MFKHARRRQRQGRFALVMSALAVALIALIIAFGRGGPNVQSPGSHAGLRLLAARAESPTVVFVQDPYMGVACHVPNVISCDRVGLAVWLRRPAAVTATIAGERLTLNDATWSYASHVRGRTIYVYAGFLQPAHLITRLGVVPEPKWTNSWLGANAPSPVVRFRIDYGNGNIVTTQAQVYLSAGWG